jgi:hypothetical protein
MTERIKTPSLPAVGRSASLQHARVTLFLTTLLTRAMNGKIDRNRAERESGAVRTRRAGSCRHE